MEAELLKRKLERERLARKQAEQILEAKALELFQANEALIKLNDNLEDQIKQRTADLNIALERAEKAQKAEQQFLANMSHEIRTPLNAIIGMSHLLKNSELDQKQIEYLDILSDSAGILKGLVSDILDMSKIDSGKAELKEETFDLGEVGERLIKAFSLRAHEKGILLEADIVEKGKYFVATDKQWLNQILINLLSNAIKFTSSGSVKLSIQEKTISADSSNFHFEVSDTGIGMDEDEKKKVFSEFKQANADINRNYGGTGLGLSIATSLVGLLGGKLGVISEKGKGSKFFFDLNLKNSEKPEQVNNFEASGNSSFENISVLVVEDNVMNQKYIGSLLQNWKVSYVLAENGAVGIQKYKDSDFDLVFMDISMPIMDGYEATRGIRSLDKKQVPIIALTASNLLSKKELALKSGMNDFLAKPFTPDELSKVFYKYFHLRQKIQDDSNLDFQFDESLDRKNLLMLYGDDYKYASDMFSIYLEVIDDEIEVLNQKAKSGEAEMLRQQAHKIKPMFSLVGLTKISAELEKLEKMAHEESQENILQVVQQLIVDINSTKPLIRNEYNNLKATISK